MEIAMKFDCVCYRTPMIAPSPASVCADLLRKEIFLPSDTLKIYAVFTKKRVSNAFRIEPPDYDGHSRLAGIKEYMLSWTRTTLGKAYNKGYRYVRIEY